MKGVVMSDVFENTRRCAECGNDDQLMIGAVVIDTETHGDYLVIRAGLDCMVCGHLWEAEEWSPDDAPDESIEDDYGFAWDDDMPVSGVSHILSKGSYLFEVEIVEYADGRVEADVIPLEYGCAEDIPW